VDDCHAWSEFVARFISRCDSLEQFCLYILPEMETLHYLVPILSQGSKFERLLYPERSNIGGWRARNGLICYINSLEEGRLYNNRVPNYPGLKELSPDYFRRSSLYVSPFVISLQA